MRSVILGSGNTRCKKQSSDTVKSKGLEQTAKYRDTKAPDCPAYLVIFDRRSQAKEKPWDEKVYWQEEAVPGGMVTKVFGKLFASLELRINEIDEFLLYTMS